MSTRRLLSFLALPCLVACRTTIPLGSLGDVTARRPHVLLVTEEDSSVFRVLDPTVVGDTIIGMVKGEPRRIPFGRVSRLHANVADPLRTVALLSAIAGAAAVVAIETHSPRTQDQCPAAEYDSIGGSLVRICLG